MKRYGSPRQGLVGVPVGHTRPSRFTFVVTCQPFSIVYVRFSGQNTWISCSKKQIVFPKRFRSDSTMLLFPGPCSPFCKITFCAYSTGLQWHMHLPHRSSTTQRPRLKQRLVWRNTVISEPRRALSEHELVLDGRVVYIHIYWTGPFQLR